MIRPVGGLPFLTLKTREDREPYSQRAHSHGEVSLGYIRADETVISAGGKDFLLREGDMVLIAAEAAHLCTPRDREAFRFDMLYLERRWWEAHMDCPAAGFPVLARPAPEDMRVLFGELEEKGEGTPAMERRLVEYLSSLTDPFKSDVPGADAADPLEALHREISRKPQISGSLENLAARAGMGKFSFIRKYAARYGLTPHADIVNMRIQRAILLFESESSLAGIAQACGFSDQSHFVHQFKLYTGMTPREYREGVRGAG